MMHSLLFFIYLFELQLNFDFQICRCGPPTHVEMIQKIKDNLKTTQRTFAKVMKELAVYEAEKVNQMIDQPKYYCLHRTDGIDSDFYTVFIRHLNNKEMFLFLTSGDETSTKGQMLCQGKSEDVNKLGTRLCALLDGKGNGKNGRFQGKVNNLKQLNECRQAIKEYFGQ